MDSASTEEDRELKRSNSIEANGAVGYPSMVSRFREIQLSEPKRHSSDKCARMNNHLEETEEARSEGKPAEWTGDPSLMPRKETHSGNARPGFSTPPPPGMVQYYPSAGKEYHNMNNEAHRMGLPSPELHYHYSSNAVSNQYYPYSAYPQYPPGYYPPMCYPNYPYADPYYYANFPQFPYPQYQAPYSGMPPSLVRPNAHRSSSSSSIPVSQSHLLGTPHKKSLPRPSQFRPQPASFLSQVQDHGVHNAENEEFILGIIKEYEDSGCDCNIIKGKVRDLAITQTGSRFLQKMLGKASPSLVAFFLEDVRSQ